MSRSERRPPLYDRIGTQYDVTRRADPDLVGRLVHHLNATSTSECLDMACGTGNYTIAVAQTGIRMHGIDQSWRMIAAAREKSPTVTWHIGNVEALPFHDGVFAGVLCTLAIHHFQALQPAFQEVFRVLAPGRFVLFTSTAEQMRGYWLNAYFPTAMIRSITQMASLPAIMQALRMYLDLRVRAGISTFAALADPSEVEDGCRKLTQDIESGRIAEVIARYQHAQGDYLFVVGEKAGR